MPNQVEEVRLREETLAHLKEVMRDAVREGMRDLVTEEAIEAFWAGGLAMLQKQAAQRTGKFVLGGLAGLAQKAAVFLVLGGALYAWGGWAALAKFIKLFSAGSPP